MGSSFSAPWDHQHNPFATPALDDPKPTVIPLYGWVTSPYRLTGDPQDGTYPGRLVIRPSRDVARLTRRLDRYFGGILDFELPVEIITENPEWYNPDVRALADSKAVK